MGIVRNDDGEFFDTEEQALRVFNIEGGGEVGEVIETGDGQYVDVDQKATRAFVVNSSGGGGTPFAPAMNQSVRYNLNLAATEANRLASPRNFNLVWGAPSTLMDGEAIDPLFGLTGQGTPLVPAGGWLIAEINVFATTTQVPGPGLNVFSDAGAGLADSKNRMQQGQAVNQWFREYNYTEYLYDGYATDGQSAIYANLSSFLDSGAQDITAVTFAQWKMIFVPAAIRDDV